MDLTIPIYIEERRPKGGGARFGVRPLFFGREAGRAMEHLGQATNKLAEILRRMLDGMAQEARQEQLAAWTFSPTLEEHRVRVDLTLRRQTARFSILVVTYEALGRRLAMVPQLPGVEFEVRRGQQVESRANEVLLEYFLKLEKDEENFEVPARLKEFCNDWVSSLEMDVKPDPRLKRADDLKRIFLGARGEMSGRQELHRVGRCLDWLYPDDLDRALLRDGEVEELVRRLAETDRRPVLLLGPRGAGKTAVVQECVYRRVAARGTSPHKGRENVWLLSPQRLISGMSYVGQWENRLLAILKEAKERDHVIYFEDLLGLYYAGVSASSDLNAAQVLRPIVERREVRLLAEMTPEAFAVLRERDRAFADLFHVIPVKEMTEPQARRVMVAAMRQFEARYDVAFGLDVLPAVMDLQQRYVRDIALPGKAAGFLRQLAVKHRKGGVNRKVVLEDFRARSGLSLSFLDGDVALPREEVAAALSKKILGQRAAVAAMADVVCIAKARLNDPGRPLAAFLFVGPTGVGKTQAAKALAEYLFGDADRLVRFDMNECVDAHAAARLVGTFRDPEGLLTSAVRRQPFCVLLLDEIEKAHPAVFDLLLAVMGEGRLTDARGRTVDFSNALVILTSNLGVSEAGRQFGLRPADMGAQADDATYVGAAERFFRPEFVNRLDRIVPFGRLERQDVAGIARLLIKDVFHRDGLLHRECVLEVDPEAMERIVESGYHPQLGARALKREIEKQITQPVATRLAAMKPGAPAVVHVYPSADGDAVDVRIDELAHVKQEAMTAPGVAEQEPEDVLDATEAFLERVETEMAGREASGQITQGKISAEQFRYLALREQVRHVRQIVARIDRQVGAKAGPKRAGPGVRAALRAAKRKKLGWIDDAGSKLWKALSAAEAVGSRLAEFSEPEGDGDHQPMRDQLVELAEESALLATMAADDALDRALILLRAPGETGEAFGHTMARWYQFAFEKQYGTTVARVTAAKERRMLPEHFDVLLAEMPNAYAVLRGEEGTHLLMAPGRGIVPVQAWVMPVKEDEDALEMIKAFFARHRRWRQTLEGEDPLRHLPVVRVCDPESATADLRTGLVARGLPDAHEARRFMVAGLKLPEELAELL